MTQALGADVQLMIIEEAAWGTTPLTPSGYIIPVTSIGGNWFSRELIPNPTLRSNRNPSKPVRGNTTVSGNFVTPLGLEYIGWILKHAIGDPETTSTTVPYTHTSKCGFAEDAVGAMELGLTMEIGHTVADQYHSFTGCRLNGFTVTGSSEGVCTFDVQVVGQDYAQSTSSLDAAPTSYTDTPIDHFLMTMEEGGSSIATIKSCSLTFSNNIDTSQYVIGSAGQVGALPAGVASVTGSITALFEDDTLLTKAENYTESDLDLIWVSGSHSLTLQVPELVYSPATPTISGPAGIEATLNFQGYYADHADATVLKSILVNTTADY
jgi:hypothetical protein